MNNKKTGVELIAEERKRQIEKEGWTAEHDTEHDNGELLQAAEAYLMRPNIPEGTLKMLWPFDSADWKPTPDNRMRELVKAGALIAAEIDRLQNL